MKVYKATDKDMKCRGLQYEIGKTVDAEGPLKLCMNGLHACEAPLELFDYYSPADGSRYFEAEVEEVSPERNENSSKVVAKKLTLGAEIGIPGLVKAHIEYVKEAGNGAKIGSSGNGAKIGSSGYGAQIGSSGYGAQIGSSGNGAQIGSSGYGAQIGSSGYGAQIGSSGNVAKIGSSGNGAQIGSSGNVAQIGSSGDWAQIGSSGDWAKIGSSGYGAQIECNGKNAVAMCAGANSCIKGPVGTWITLAEYNDDGECVLCKSAKIDGELLKSDTWYTLNDGEFVEVPDNV